MDSWSRSQQVRILGLPFDLSCDEQNVGRLVILMAAQPCHLPVMDLHYSLVGLPTIILTSNGVKVGV